MIDWIPYYLSYCDRVKCNKLKPRGAPIMQLLARYLEKIHFPLAWMPAALCEQIYIFPIAPVEILEAEAALKAFQGKPKLAPQKSNAGQRRFCSLLECMLIQVRNYLDLSQPLSTISRMTFPLPSLGPRIVGIARQLDFGCGLFALRGFDPKKYSSKENVVLYARVANYVEDKHGRQDVNGCMLCEYIHYSV